MTVRPRLLWTGDELRLYYSLSESIFMDTLAERPALEVVDTRRVASGGAFDVTVTEPGQVALITAGRLYIEGVSPHDSGIRFGSNGPLSWNADNFLAADVLGHGEWWLQGLTADGKPRSPAIDHRFCGSCAAFFPGISFAAAADSGRHALITVDGELSFAVEGHAPVERGLMDSEADGSLFADGDRYVILLADQSDDGAVPGFEEPRRRDIVLLVAPGTAPEQVEEQEARIISQDPGDEVRPVGVAAGPGDYGIAWVRGADVVFQHCALAER